MSTAAIVVLVVVGLVVLFAAGWFLGGRMRSRRLRDRFGPEYDRHLEEAGDRRAAERELTEREKRHAKLSLRPLPAEARARYADGWARVQAQFVDEPGPSVLAADGLVHEAMRECGYPDAEFEQRAADLSVAHPTVTANYRAGAEISGRHGHASTEELRQAMVHYRAVLAELLGSGDPVEGAHDGVPAPRESRAPVNR